MDEYIPLLLELAKNFPWILLSLGSLFGAYKSVIFLSNYLFDKDTGQLTLLLIEQRTFIQSVRTTNETIAAKINQTDGHIERLNGKVDKVEEDVDIIKEDVKFIKTKIS